MILRSFLAAALGAAASAAPAAAICPPEDAQLLLHACNGGFTVAGALLPEDAGLMETALEHRLVVTGVYTSAERRAGGLPMPVGLFVRAGEVVSRQFARMDGILVIGGDGQPQVFHRARVRLAGRRFDLTVAAQRAAFLERAAALGLTVMQTHLLIVDGRVDVTPTPDAPRFIRRLLFVDAEGRAGLWQSAAALTLHDAAAELLAAQGARMALNLDMGSYDFCLRQQPGDGPVEGARCGLISWLDAGKLSNLLVFDLTGR